MRLISKSVKMGIYVFSLLCLSVIGCGTFSVRTLPPQYETVFIKFINNGTLEYGAEERLTESLVSEFQRDGRLTQVADWQSADLVLEVTIDKYTLVPVVLDNDNRTTGRTVDVAITAEARDVSNGLFVMQPQQFKESGTFFLTNTPNGRREDDVNRRLGQKVISRLLEGWG